MRDFKTHDNSEGTAAAFAANEGSPVRTTYSSP
jgi:hypothetical protein